MKTATTTAINKRKLIKYKDRGIYNDQVYQGYHHNKVNDGNDIVLREGQDLCIVQNKTTLKDYLEISNFKNSRRNGLRVKIVFL